MYHWTLLSSGPGRAAVTRRGVHLEAWTGRLERLTWSVIAARASGVLAGTFLAAGACFSNQAEGSGKPRPM